MDIGGGMGGGFRCDAEKSPELRSSEFTQTTGFETPPSSFGIQPALAGDTLSPQTWPTLPAELQAQRTPASTRSGSGGPSSSSGRERAGAESSYLPRACSENGGPSCYYPGCAYHSWARAANVSKAVFRPPLEWVDYNKAQPAAYDEAIADSCVRFLASQPRRSDVGSHRSPDDPLVDPEPFFLYCSINSPHPPMWTNATWLKQVASREQVEAILPERPPVGGMHPYDVYQSFSEGVAQANVSRADFVMYVRTYLGRVAMADALMGRVIDAFESTWAADSALRLFVADHGEMKLQDNLVEKMSPYDASVRIPFIVSPPRDGSWDRYIQAQSAGVDSESEIASGSAAASPPRSRSGFAAPLLQRNSTDSTPLSLLDVFPTLYDFAAGQLGAAHANVPGLAGQSLAGYLGLVPIPLVSPDSKTQIPVSAGSSLLLGTDGPESGSLEAARLHEAAMLAGIQSSSPDNGAKPFPSCGGGRAIAYAGPESTAPSCEQLKSLGLAMPISPTTGLRTFSTSQFHGEESNTAAFAVRQGPWKLVLYGPAMGYEHFPTQLFNLTADPNERRNLAANNPAVVTHMTSLLASQYDWVAADASAKEEQRENFIAWVHSRSDAHTMLAPSSEQGQSSEGADGLAGSSSSWQDVLQQCYDGLDHEDFTRFETWMEGTA